MRLTTVWNIAFNNDVHFSHSFPVRLRLSSSRKLSKKNNKTKKARHSQFLYFRTRESGYQICNIPQIRWFFIYLTKVPIHLGKNRRLSLMLCNRLFTVIKTDWFIYWSLLWGHWAFVNDVIFESSIDRLSRLSRCHESTVITLSNSSKWVSFQALECLVESRCPTDIALRRDWLKNILACVEHFYITHLNLRESVWCKFEMYLSAIIFRCSCGKNIIRIIIIIVG